MNDRAPAPALLGPGSVSVIAWRRARLERAGFQSDLAEALAGDCRVDLHALLELAERGCPPELAARIMAPLDTEPRRRC